MALRKGQVDDPKYESRNRTNRLHPVPGRHDRSALAVKRRSLYLQAAPDGTRLPVEEALIERTAEKRIASTSEHQALSCQTA